MTKIHASSNKTKIMYKRKVTVLRLRYSYEYRKRRTVTFLLYMIFFIWWCMDFHQSILYAFYLCSTSSSNWLVHVYVTTLDPWNYWFGSTRNLRLNLLDCRPPHPLHGIASSSGQLRLERWKEPSTSLPSCLKHVNAIVIECSHTDIFVRSKRDVFCSSFLPFRTTATTKITTTVTTI